MNNPPKGHRHGQRSHEGAGRVNAGVGRELKEWSRGRIQEWMQQLLVEEVTEFLGRAKHQRRGVNMHGYRNGYGKPRRLTMRSGTVTATRRPRVRDLDERFESRLLPLFSRRTQEVRDLLPALNLHGLGSGDFELASRRGRSTDQRRPTPGGRRLICLHTY